MKQWWIREFTVYMDMYVICTYVYMYSTHMYIRIYVYIICVYMYVYCVCVCVNVYICMYVYVHTYVCICIYKHVHTCTVLGCTYMYVRVFQMFQKCNVDRKSVHGMIACSPPSVHRS